jgi:hypothetical protein
MASRGASFRPSLAHAWNAHETPALHGGLGSLERDRGSIMKFRTLQIAAMWVFLGPLIVILGTIDILTAGRSRVWLLGQ